MEFPLLKLMVLCFDGKRQIKRWLARVGHRLSLLLALISDLLVLFHVNTKIIALRVNESENSADGFLDR